MLVHVAVPVPALDLLTYAVPEDLGAPAIGARALVPLGNRLVTGIVIDVDVREEPRSVKPIHQLLDRSSFVPPDLVALARWTADYYACGVGDTIPALLPPMARGARADAHKTARIAAITTAGREALESGFAERRIGSKQREALERLSTAPAGIATTVLTARGISAAIVTGLAGHGYVSIRQERLDRDPWAQTPARAGTIEPDPASRPLTPEQHAALDRLQALAVTRRFTVALLHGVTGSGKTEIYLRLAALVRQAGLRVLMLVPEIALTPAVAAQFRDAFGERVAIQHSALSDGERHDQWQRIRRGEVDVVVGTRSAVFAPVQNLGLIIVDEEHDASYKQEESPRYNGRDVAVVRGQRAEALVLLGSATPSMESYHNAITGRYARIVMEHRVLDRPLAAVRIVDMREEYARDGPDVILSRALGDAIGKRVASGEQALVLLNRRGFATAVFCRQCAGVLDCPNCSVSLVIHGEGRARRARCHYCNYTARVPATCPMCGGPYLEQTGFGTQRVEVEVSRLCPNARVARLDRDAVRRKGALDTLLQRFSRGDIDVLVGTQMIAKGHDFPGVTLVGVVSADVGLGIADFRASERTFQLLTQVAGRAGRGDQPGEAIVQTLNPHHYSVQLACRQDYSAFYEREIRFRRTMRYPPLVSLVNAIVRARTFSAAIDDADDVGRRVRQQTGDRRDVRVLGPAPAPLGRLRGDYRAQLLLKGVNRKRLRETLLAALAARPDLQKRVVVDVDPLNVL